jgi:hypothetical protein
VSCGSAGLSVEKAKLFIGNATNVSVWSTIEAGAGIISGCMATLRPLVQYCSNEIHSLRSSISEPVVESQLTDFNSTSMDEKDGKNTQQIDSEGYRGGDSGLDVQRHDVRHYTSHSTGCGSEEYILSQETNFHMCMVSSFVIPIMFIKFVKKKNIG